MLICEILKKKMYYLEKDVILLMWVSIVGALTTCNESA